MFQSFAIHSHFLRLVVGRAKYSRQSGGPYSIERPQRLGSKWSAAAESGITRRAMAGSDLLLIFLLKGLRPEKYRERVTLPPHELDKLIEQALAERRGEEQLSETVN
jgi:hypothetical protein